MFSPGFRTSPTEYHVVRADSGPAGSASRTAVFPLHHSARISDLLVSLLLVGLVPVPGLPIGSFDQVGLLILAILAIFRRPVRAVPVWYPAAALGLMAFLIFESAINGIEPGAFVQRSLNISLSLVIAGFMASGRVDVASVVKGIGIAMAINTVLFYAGVAPHPYGAFLTGYIADKNVSGLFFAAIPLLLASALSRWWQRIALVVASGGALWLTGSRTSMAAYAAALVWLAIAQRGNWLMKLGAAGGLFAAFLYASDNLSHIGEFVVREGSDEFRAQIDAATAVKVASTPWYGKGLSEATVTLSDGGQWFFHDSYAALWVEGGIVMTVVVLALYGGALVALAFRVSGAGSGDDTESELRAESNASAKSGLTRGGFQRLATAAALGVVLLCATRLGEVFMAQIGFIVLGVALALLFEGRPYEASPWALSATTEDPVGNDSRGRAQ